VGVDFEDSASRRFKKPWSRFFPQPLEIFTRFSDTCLGRLMRNLAAGTFSRLTKAVLALAFLISPALAQRFSFKYYGQEQGLSNLATEYLFQDRAGYLWAGTQNGLFRRTSQRLD
jgi:hypothetical protein